MVYFIRMKGTNFIKIGFTSRDLKERMAELQTAAPLALELLTTFEGDESIESELHRQCWQYKTNGGDEWFEIPDQILEGILGKYDSNSENFNSAIGTSAFDVRPLSRRQLDHASRIGENVPGLSAAFDNAIHQPLFSSLQQKR